MLEWNYGDYEGRTTSEILKQRPGWLLFRDGCPNGEQPAEVAARADRVIARLRAADDRRSCFRAAISSECWPRAGSGSSPSDGRLFMLSTASVSILGYEHGKDEPAVQLWNEV